jgi:hypothetical protein
LKTLGLVFKPLPSRFFSWGINCSLSAIEGRHPWFHKLVINSSELLTFKEGMACKSTPT